MKYEIRIWQDNEYAVYDENNMNEPLFIGSLEEVNAWISLKEKGYNF